MLTRFAATLCLAATLLTAPAGAGQAAQEAASPADILREAEATLATDPGDRKARVAAAQAALALGDRPAAIRHLEVLRGQSDNFAVRQALILEYAAAGNWERHADVVGDILILAEQNALPEQIMAREVFALETYSHGDHDVRVFRHLEPSGAHRHVFTGMVSRRDAPEDPPLMITFGSTVVSDEFDLKENPDRPYDRLYSMDTHLRPADGGYRHETLGFATAVPPYPEFRDAIGRYLDGEAKPLSTSSVGKPD